MSPVLGAGGTGYDDYQRTQNWDSAELYSFTAPPSSSTLFSPVLAVPRWAYIEGYITPNTGIAGVSLTWFTDAGGLDTTGIVQFFIDPAITSPCQFRFPNMGPYVQAALGTPPVGNWGATGRMFASNRVQPFTMIPQQPTLINMQAAAIGASTSLTLRPNSYYAGASMINAWCSGAYQVSVASPQPNGTYGTQWATNVIPAATWSQTFVTLPVGAWSVGMENTVAAAGTYYAIVTPSATGAN